MAAYASGVGGGLPGTALLPAPADTQPIQPVGAPEEVRDRVAATRGRRGEEFHVLVLDCGDRELALVIERGLRAERLTSTPAAPGFVAVHHTGEVDHWTAPFDILTEPQASRSPVRIAVIDGRGRLVYGGAGRVDPQRLTFSVQAADRPGAVAILVEGDLSSDGLFVTLGESARVWNRVPLEPERR